jgi:probable rRNA maturation factor
MSHSFLALDTKVRLDPSFPLSRRELTGVVGCLLEALGLTGAEVSLTLIDDATMAVMNREHLGGDGPTNILSFPETDQRRPRSLGALYLSVDTLGREAYLYGQEPACHLARLLAHGILHLAGFDHSHEMDVLTDIAVEAVCPQPHDAGFANDATPA